MLPVSADTCLRCHKPRTLPAFSVTPVTPRCACVSRDPALTKEHVDQAVQDALAAYRAEHAADDIARIVMRLSHVATCAGEAWINQDKKFYLSCLISSSALSRLLMERGVASVRDGVADASSQVVGSRTRDS